MLKVWDIINWETIFFTQSSHKILFLPIILLLFLLLIISFFIKYLNIFYWEYYLIILWQLFLVYVYYLFIEYELSRIIVTDKSIIFFNRQWFLKRNFIQLSFKEITEIKAKKNGFFQMFFNYWNIEIKKNNEEHYIKNIPDAIWLLNKILKK